MSGKRRSSRRRSSFAPGRVRLQQGGACGGNKSKCYLYHGIDKDQPDDERLSQLTKACLQYTLQKMEDEMKGEDFQSLKKEIEDSVLRRISHMEESGMFRDYTQKKKYLPNPVNLEMDVAVEDTNKLINRMEEEMESWERALKEADDKAKEFSAVQSPAEITPWNIGPVYVVHPGPCKNKEKIVLETQLSHGIKFQAADYVGNKPDYQEMLKDAEDKVKSTQLSLYQNSTNVQKLQTTCDTVKTIIDSQLPKLKSEVFQYTDSPRKIIAQTMTQSSPNLQR